MMVSLAPKGIDRVIADAARQRFIRRVIEENLPCTAAHRRRGELSLRHELRKIQGRAVRKFELTDGAAETAVYRYRARPILDQQRGVAVAALCQAKRKICRRDAGSGFPESTRCLERFRPCRSPSSET